MKDILGKALLDYHQGHYTEDIVTWTTISEEDVLPLPYLFRTFEDMPKIEQHALKLCKGYVLDVGCGSGSHSLWLQNKGLNVKAIDKSKGAISVAKDRGVINAELLPLLEETGTFDTILLLMNGTGIFGKLSDVPKYLEHLKELLNPGGQILLDSSDIAYMYRDDDGGYWHDVQANYYGELDYFMSYKGEEEIPLTWLYMDFNTLNIACASMGLICEKIMDGERYDYLARIIK
ncbi:MAG: class I SAM-dependent methyltransferase [Bacteroidota bacterium]